MRLSMPVYATALIAMLMAILAPVAEMARAAEGVDRRAAVEIGAPPSRGLVKSVHQAALSSDLNTPITRIGFREGERFSKGAVLVTFDCGRQRFELAALQAQVKEMEVTVEASHYLTRNGAGNRTEADIAKARLARARAEWSALEYRLESCVIVAPFDGVVTELTINTHEIPQPSRPFLTISGYRDLEIEIIVPSRLLGMLADDAIISFVVDETRRSYGARIVRTGGAVDAVSQTMKIYGVFVDEAAGVLPGMSGTAHVNGDRIAGPPVGGQ